MNATNDSLVDSLLGQWHRQKWLLISVFTLILSVGVSMIITMPSLYRSSTTILFGQGNITESLVKISSSNELEMRLGVIQQAVLSRTQLQEVIDKYDLYQTWRERASSEWLVERMRKDITIDKKTSAQPQWGQNATYAITITYQGWDAEVVSAVANELAERFRSENERMRISQASHTTNFIRQELEDARTDFITQELRINAFRNEHIGELPEQQQLNLTTLERLNADLRLNRERQLQLLKERDAMVSGKSKSIDLSGPLRLQKLKAELANLRTNYKDSYPGILRLKNEIRTLSMELGIDPDTEQSSDTGKNSAVDKTDRELNTLKRQESQLNRDISEMIDRIEGAPKIDQQLQRFAYDYESAKEKYVSLQKKYQDAQLAESLEAQQNQQIRVIEAAIPAAYPIAPNKFGLLILTAFFGLALAGNAAFLAEQSDRSFHSISGIRQFTNVPVLASISTIATPAGHVKQALRATAAVLIFLFVLGALSNAAYDSGKEAQTLVWMLAG